MDEEHTGARALRIFVGLLWVAHSFIWLHTGGMAWMTCAVAALILAGYLAARLRTGSWGPAPVPIAAVLVVLSGPIDFAVSRVQNAPVGVLAVIGSFLLFGLGTLAALTKHRWNKEHSQNRPHPSSA
jgi:hypothetical protein